MPPGGALSAPYTPLRGLPVFAVAGAGVMPGVPVLAALMLMGAGGIPIEPPAADDDSPGDGGIPIDPPPALADRVGAGGMAALRICGTGPPRMVPRSFADPTGGCMGATKGLRAVRLPTPCGGMTWGSMAYP